MFNKGLNYICLFLIEVWMTEGPRVNFVMREALFEIYTWILGLSYLYEKQTVELNHYIYTLSKLSRFGYEISVFKYTTGRYSEQPPEQPAHTSRQHLHWKMHVKIFLMFIVAENIGSVNIYMYIRGWIKKFWNYSHISLIIRRNYIKLIQNTKLTFPNFAMMFEWRSTHADMWRHHLMTSCNSDGNLPFQRKNNHQFLCIIWRL